MRYVNGLLCALLGLFVGIFFLIPGVQILGVALLALFRTLRPRRFAAWLTRIAEALEPVP